MAYPYASDKDEVLSRLRKIEGQLRGIQRMVEDDKAPVDVLTQVSAAISGLEKVGLRMVREHMHSALAEAPKAQVDELVRVVERFLQT